MLQLRLLGEMEVLQDGGRLPLPPSRKTRALLAYLAGSARPQRRDRLCSMFWDLPDDPRGALRWSVSRLRAVVDEPALRRIVADRETVAFDPQGAVIDLALVRALPAASQLADAELEEAASLFRGEFLEGLDLPNQHDFQAWCVALREDLRRLQVRLLTEWARRHPPGAPEGLVPARQLVQVDPFNESARMDLLARLLGCDRKQEAESHFESAARLYREIGEDAVARLTRAWRQMNREQTAQASAAARPVPDPQPVLPAVRPRQGAAGSGLIWREQELALLAQVIAAARRERQARLALVLGEPGMGKSSLVREALEIAACEGDEVLLGRSYDARLQPVFGPWKEALGTLPEPEGEADQTFGRERLHAMVVAEILRRSAASLVIALEDVHWADEASADLLHYLVRAARHFPLTVILTAREGELPDNPAVNTVLRSLRRDVACEEIRMQPLGEEVMLRLVGEKLAPPAARDLARLSGGNPLYALELLRNADDGVGAIPRPLKELVRDRVERLPPPAAELLRWASVLGTVVRVQDLLRVAEPDLVQLTRLLETLERNALLVPVEGGAGAGTYVFSHELVRQAIHTGLSEPRRRLMHLKVAQLLEASASGQGEEALEIAHHAAAGGDARMAAEACLAAGRHCMRLFANADALRLARQGQAYAVDLPEPVRTECLVGLTEIEARSERPADPADLLQRAEALAEKALDHGRPDLAGRCYIVLATLRWEGGAWSDARQATMRMEIVSRASNDHGRVLALSEAGRCLAMLERDLPTAESLVLEAEAIARRIGQELDAIADATGLLRCFRGEFSEAEALFEKARIIARRDGERVNEFLAAEHLLTLEIELGRFDAAMPLSDEIVRLAGKFRIGSELPFARALQALCRMATGEENARDELHSALADLRRADSKHRLAFAASSAARLFLARGEAALAQELASEALQAAGLLNRQSDMAAALAILLQIAVAQANAEQAESCRSRLENLLAGGVSRNARQAAEEALSLLLDRQAAHPV